MQIVTEQKAKGKRQIANKKFLPFVFYYLPFALFTLAVLAIIYARHGYVYGSSDQSETLPYVLWLNNHNLYPSDFYLQSIIQHPFNERRFFVEFLRLFSSNLKYCVFFLHAICTASLLWGIYFYARRRFDNSFIKTWIAMLVSLIFLYGLNTGASELYDNTFNPGYVANILGIWVLILIEKRKLLFAICLLIVATFFQPLIGVLLTFLFFLSEATMPFFKLNENKKESRTAIHFRFTLAAYFLLYCCTAGVYVYSLSHQISVRDTTNFGLQIIEMRAPHHYFPNYFPIIGYIFMLVCLGLVFLYGTGIEKIWSFYIFAGCLFYALEVYFFKSNLILNTQWFRVTMWVKLWGTLIIIQQIINYLEKKNSLKLSNVIFKRSIFVVSLFCILITLPSFRVFKNRDYMFPFFKNIDPVIEIAEHAQNATPIDALFMTPPNFESFRYYSKRSNYIDFKALLHENNYFKTWYERIHSVYGLSLDQKEKGFKLVPIAKDNFNTLSDSTLRQLCLQNHIGFVIRDNAHPIQVGFTKIYSTAIYSIYKLL